MNILYLSPWYPFPPDNGAKIRTYGLIRSLARRHHVTLLSFCEDGEVLANERRPDFCEVAGVAPRRDFRPRCFQSALGYLSPVPRSLVNTYSPEMAALVRAQTSRPRYEVLIASEISMASYYGQFAGLKGILEDLEMAAIRDQSYGGAGRRPRWRGRLTWAKTRRYIGGLVKRFAATTVVSEQERNYLSEAAPDYRRGKIIPNGVDVEWLGSVQPDPQPDTLIFNGALTYSANLDAVSFFLSDILPRIQASAPDVCLAVTGRTGGFEKGLVHDGVRFTGYLPDIRPAVASAWACVAPLRIGAGTRLKILEAMALGTPVVSTRKGAEGLEVTPGEDILIADEPEQFAFETLRLLRDPGLRARLAANGRRLVREKYDWQMIGQEFCNLVERVANGQEILA